MSRFHIIAVAVLTGLVIVLTHVNVADHGPDTKVMELELKAPVKSDTKVAGYRPQYENTPVQFVAPVTEPTGL